MPFSLLPVSLLLPAVAISVGLIALVALGLLVREAFVPALEGDKSLRPPRKSCRYCRFGRAVLNDESVRVEGDDLVEVRCFVCRSCGLPQWTVNRSPVLRRAA